MWSWCETTTGDANPFRQMEEARKQHIMDKFAKFEVVFEERHYVKTMSSPVRAEIVGALMNCKDSLNQLQCAINNARLSTSYSRSYNALFASK